MLGLRRVPLSPGLLMHTMLGMSSCDSIMPFAKQTRAAALTQWWGLASSMPLPQVQSRASRARARSARLMCRLRWRAAARAIFTTSRSASKSKDTAAGAKPCVKSSHLCTVAERAFICLRALFAASKRCLRLLHEGFHMLASRAERAAAAVLAHRRSAAACSSRASSAKRRATSRWLGLDSSAAAGASTAATGRAGHSTCSACGSDGTS
mmetsp:Transcript_80768/g.250765  ORF Transcript_80768/g.250765 Transcript_80768/m.250765 type:complete len:209 (+) Transcript_80768:82-708(+)